MTQKCKWNIRMKRFEKPCSLNWTCMLLKQVQNEIRVFSCLYLKVLRVKSWFIAFNGWMSVTDGYDSIPSFYIVSKQCDKFFPTLLTLIDAFPIFKYVRKSTLLQGKPNCLTTNTKEENINVNMWLLSCAMLCHAVPCQHCVVK